MCAIDLPTMRASPKSKVGQPLMIRFFGELSWLGLGDENMCHPRRLSSGTRFDPWQPCAVATAAPPQPYRAGVLGGRNLTWNLASFMGAGQHLPNLLSYFLYRITNATSEGFNSVIQALKYAARGFRSFANYRTRILFFCSRLDLKPQLRCHPKSRRTGDRRSEQVPQSSKQELFGPSKASAPTTSSSLSLSRPARWLSNSSSSTPDGGSPSGRQADT